MSTRAPRKPLFPKRLRWCFLLAAFQSVAFAQNDLPKRVPGERLDVEPQLMLNDLPNGFASDYLEPAAPAAPAAEAQALEVKLGKAKKTAAWSARLFKSGLIAKVQAEIHALAVVRLTMELDRARQKAAADAHEAAQKQLAAGETGKEEADQAAAQLLSATQAAEESLAKWKEAEMRDAELGLFRQRQLMASGIGRKSDVRRAEEKLAALKAPKP